MSVRRIIDTLVRRGLWTVVFLLPGTPCPAQLNDNLQTPRPPAGTTATGERGIVIQGVVNYINEPLLAFEEAGVITEIPTEGQVVQKNDVIARLNDEEVELKIAVADYVYRAAQKEAENEIKIQYAEAQAKTNLADYLAGEESNRKAPGVVTEMEMRRRKLEYESSRLAILNAQYDKQVAELTATAKEKELRVAEHLRKRVQLRAPISGIVTEKRSHVGEYVRPGDPIVKIGQLDRLRVEGRVPMALLSPTMAKNREVVVQVVVGKDSVTGEDKLETFRGRLEHVAAEVDQEEKYRVWTEIDNRDDYVVRKGMNAKMIILE